MLRVALSVVAALLAASPAHADRILYATANDQTNGGANRVDGFCVRGDGGLAPVPSHQIQTNGILPRRLLVRARPDGTGVLYVAERDRVEAFSIRPGGGLQRMNATQPIKNMIPRDIALSPDGRTIYVPQPERDRVVAYPLEDDGSFTQLAADDARLTCIQGQVGSKYDNVIPADSLLYVSAPGTNRVEIFDVADDKIASTVTNSDGSVGPVTSGKTCVNPLKTGRALTNPVSIRTKLQGPRSLLLNGNVLIVEERFIKRIATFDMSLNGGVFCNHAKTDSTTCVAVPPAKSKKDKYQQRRGRSAKGNGYDGLLIVPTANAAPPPAASTLYGTQFFHGRIDAYNVPASGQLPMRPNHAAKIKVRTPDDLKTSPVRMATDDGTLYVAAGALDRVQAYRIRTSDGMLKSTDPFSMTDEQTGSFPNDVAIAVLSGDCR